MPGSRSSPGDFSTGKASASQLHVGQRADVGLQQEQPHQAGHGDRRGDRRREDEAEHGDAAQELVGEHGEADAEHEPGRHRQQGELDGHPQGVQELVAAGDVDVLVPPVGAAVLAGGVAAHVPEPHRLDSG